jgi:energy-coupling factor transport system permease protein
LSPSLDPRTRLILTVLFAAVVMVSKPILWLLVELGIVLLLVLVARAGRAYLRWFRLVAVMAASWFAISLWAFDLPSATSAALRLVILTSAFFLLFHTTAPYDLGNALVKSGLPYDVAFVLSTSLQFVPVIRRKAQNVFDAQRSRGLPLEPGVRALRHYPALVTPLLVQAFELADELAEAMESRGFGRPGRTFLQEYRLGPLDWLVLAAAIIALTAVILLQGGIL